MQQPRTIMTYLCSGNPNGTKTVEFSNRLIKGIAIPRKDLKTLEVKEAEYSGIYFLIGENEEGWDLAYIGQATNLRKRLVEHYNNTKKDFWTLAIAFTYKDGSLTESDINYLEKESIYIAKKVDRYEIQNSTNWNNGLIQDYRIPDMQEFIDDLKILLANLWIPILKEFTDKKIQLDETTIYYLSNRGTRAEWIYTEEGFLVLKWSIWPLDLAPAARNNRKYYATRHRPELLQQGVIKEQWNEIVFLKDFLFSSPSAASSSIVGASSNGRNDRKTKDGKTLHEMERITSTSGER